MMWTFFVGAGIIYLRVWEALVRPTLGFFAVMACVVGFIWLFPVTLPYALGAAHFGRDPMPLWFQAMNRFMFPEQRFRPVLPPAVPTSVEPKSLDADGRDKEARFEADRRWVQARLAVDP